MSFVKLSVAQAAAINLARNHGDDTTRKNIKREIFEQVKDAHGIPREHKVKAETSETKSGDYLVLKRKTDDSTYPIGADGRWTGAAAKPVEVAPPQPPAARWFKLDKDGIDNIVDTARSTAQDGDIFGEAFTQGLTDDSNELKGAASLADDVKIDQQGNVYVQMDATEFDDAIN